MSFNKEIHQTDTKVVYKNKWMKVREDKIIRGDGSSGIYGVVEKSDFAVIIPIIDDNMILVEQYRYPVEQRFWEFPQGSWEDSSVSPEDLAKAELREETGYIAEEMTLIGHLFTAYGYSNQGYNIFVARKLIKCTAKLDPEEYGLISREFKIKTVEEMIVEQTIKDATTVAAFGLLKIKGIIS